MRGKSPGKRTGVSTSLPPLEIAPEAPPPSSVLAPAPCPLLQPARIACDASRFLPPATPRRRALTPSELAHDLLVPLHTGSRGSPLRSWCYLRCLHWIVRAPGPGPGYRRTPAGLVLRPYLLLFRPAPSPRHIDRAPIVIFSIVFADIAQLRTSTRTPGTRRCSSPPSPSWSTTGRPGAAPAA